MTDKEDDEGKLPSSKFKIPFDVYPEKIIEIISGASPSTPKFAHGGYVGAGGSLKHPQAAAGGGASGNLLQALHKVGVSSGQAANALKIMGQASAGKESLIPACENPKCLYHKVSFPEDAVGTQTLVKPSPFGASEVFLAYYTHFTCGTKIRGRFCRACFNTFAMDFKDLYEPTEAFCANVFCSLHHVVVQTGCAGLTIPSMKQDSPYWDDSNKVSWDGINLLHIQRHAVKVFMEPEGPIPLWEHKSVDIRLCDGCFAALKLKGELE